MEQNQIGNKIRELRIKHNLTQAELGKIVGVSMQAVSKWERGGTPDIQVLLLLAESFNVTLDELFGRRVDNVHKMEDALYYSMLHTPDKNKMEQACGYCWAIFKGMSGIPEMQSTAYSNAGLDSFENSRGRVCTNEGIGYSLALRDAHMVAVMPEPADGYASVLGSVERYTELFRFLSDPDALRLLLFICTRSQSLFSKNLAAQEANVPEEKVTKIFDTFEKWEWLVKEKADMDDRTVILYRPTYKEYFAFFLYFANEMMISPRFWYLSSITKRTKPLLDKIPE